MASYTIITNRTQEIGLNHSYITYADKIQYPTQQAYFQARINHQVTNPMYEDYQKAQLVLFDESFKTIPDANQPAAQAEIEGVIVAHGGEIVTPAPPTPAPGSSGGIVSTTGGEISDSIQTGDADKGILPASGRDGEGNNET